jgi:hypothetical protein
MLYLINMRLKTLNGKLIYKNCKKYLINWDKKQKSGYQTQVKDFLRKYWEKNVVYTEFPVFGSKMTLDLFNASSFVSIEIQGEHHSSYIPFFNKNRIGYLNQIKRDISKQNWCEMNKIKLIEIFPEDLDHLSPAFFEEKFGIVL